MADRLFEGLRFGGFRFDVVWLIVAFFVTGFWAARNLVDIREGQRRVINTLIGIVWCLGSAFYSRYILISGLFDMG